MEFYVSIITFTLISVIAVTGVYVLTGLTGMFSLGQAAFMAIGAYVSGVLVVKIGWPFWLATIVAVAFSVLIGYIVGLPTVRLRRDYISLVTLGFGEAITALLNQTQSITGGALGFSGIPKETTLTLSLLSAIWQTVHRSKKRRACGKGDGHRCPQNQNDSIFVFCGSNFLFGCDVCILYNLC